METFEVEIIDDETGLMYSVNLSKELLEKAQIDKSFLNKIIAGLRNGTIPSTSSQVIKESQLHTRVKDKVQDEVDDEVQDEAQDSSSGIASSEESTDTWTSQVTLQFIAEFENLQDLIEKGKIKQKDAFQKISNNLRQDNIMITAKQCATKLASLKRSYKKIKDHNQKSGNDCQTWPYFERMDTIFGKKPWINPVALCGAGPETEEPRKEKTEQVPASYTAISKKRQNSSVDHKLDELVIEQKKRREDRARQHAESMERLDKLLDVLQHSTK